MPTIPVDAESPSVTAEPSILTTVGGVLSVGAVLVSWCPERGHQCEVHQTVPCAHTDAVIPGKHPLWRQ